MSLRWTLIAVAALSGVGFWLLQPAGPPPEPEPVALSIKSDRELPRGARVCAYVDLRGAWNREEGDPRDLQRSYPITVFVDAPANVEFNFSVEAASGSSLVAASDPGGYAGRPQQEVVEHARGPLAYCSMVAKMRARGAQEVAGELWENELRFPNANRVDGILDATVKLRPESASIRTSEYSRIVSPAIYFDASYTDGHEASGIFVVGDTSGYEAKSASPQPLSPDLWAASQYLRLDWLGRSEAQGRLLSRRNTYSNLLLTLVTAPALLGAIGAFYRFRTSSRQSQMSGLITVGSFDWKSPSPELSSSRLKWTNVVSELDASQVATEFPALVVLQTLGLHVSVGERSGTRLVFHRATREGPRCTAYISAQTWVDLFTESQLTSLRDRMLAHANSKITLTTRG